MRGLFIVVRLAGAALIAAAIVGQLMLSLGVWAGLGITNPATQLVNFFSFFTIDSNVLTVAVFLIGAVLLIRGSGDDPGWFAVLRAGTTAYMATTGIVYNVLLRGIELPQGSTLPWSNEVLHVVGPILMVLDWLLAPGRRHLQWTHIWAIIAFPLVWGVYTMIRGPLTFDAVTGKDYWYPYPFLNPNIAPEGYVSVAFYIVLIAAIIGGVGALVIWVSRRGERWPLPARP
ncbi:MAG: Pr6Pr family membrane protein [Microbacteriaceae bacterium]